MNTKLEEVLLTWEQPSLFFELLRQSNQLSPLFAELEPLIGLEQDKIFHPEGDVWNHTMLVLDAAAALRSKAEHPLGFMLAALCHDLGKITATKTENGRIRSIGHETQGLPLAEAFVKRFFSDVELLRYVLNMVELHMRPNILAAQRSGLKAMCRLFELSASPEDLLLLAKADHCSRPNASPYEEAEDFLRTALAEYHRRCAMPGVTQDDLISAGFTPDENFAEALEYARSLRLAGVEKESALKQTAAYLKKLRS